MYLCVRGIDFVTFYWIFLTVPTLWYIFFHFIMFKICVKSDNSCWKDELNEWIDQLQIYINIYNRTGTAAMEDQ